MKYVRVQDNHSLTIDYDISLVSHRLLKHFCRVNLLLVEYCSLLLLRNFGFHVSTLEW